MPGETALVLKKPETPPPKPEMAPKLNSAQVQGHKDTLRTLIKVSQQEQVTDGTLSSSLAPEKAAEIEAVLDPAEKQKLVEALNGERKAAAQASGQYELCETVWEQTGQQLHSEAEARQKGGLVGVQGAGGQLEFRGRFFHSAKPMVGAEEVDLSQSTGGMVRGLRALRDGNNPQAAAVYEDLRNENAVTVTYKDKTSLQDTTVSLAQFDEAIEIEAKRQWEAESRHQGTSWETIRDSGPQVAHAYRVRAEQSIASDAKYAFKHTLEEGNPSSTTADAKTTASDNLQQHEGTESDRALRVLGEALNYVGNENNLDPDRNKGNKEKLEASWDIYTQLELVRNLILHPSPGVDRNLRLFLIRGAFSNLREHVGKYHTTVKTDPATGQKIETTDFPVMNDLMLTLAQELPPEVAAGARAKLERHFPKATKEQIDRLMEKGNFSQVGSVLYLAEAIPTGHKHEKHLQKFIEKYVDKDIAKMVVDSGSRKAVVADFAGRAETEQRNQIDKNMEDVVLSRFEQSRGAFEKFMQVAGGLSGILGMVAFLKMEALKEGSGEGDQGAPPQG